MAGWPSIERTDDRWLAQALRSGDLAATAHLYDTYAARLFDYCHVLLRDEEAAGLALLDSLVIVQERIGDLVDPMPFRGWLYAVTREECLRRRAQAEVPAERRRAAEAVGLETDEATRQLVHSSLLVLSGRQREVLDLALRHELEAGELAEVMRMTPQDVSVLVGQARHDLDDAFAAVVVAATGRDDCPSVSALAGPPGQRLDARACGRLARHITNCPICGERGNRKVATTRLLSAMPYAEVPASLRARVLAAATDPQYADLRYTIAHRPVPSAAAEFEPEEEPEATSRFWPVLVAVGVGVLILGGIFLVLPGSDSRNAGNNQAIASSPGDSPSDAPSEGDSEGPQPSGDATSPSPTPSSSSGTPTPTPTPKHKHGQSASPPGSTPPAPPQGPPPPGTLAVSGCSMHGSRSCTITVSAQGGPVSWSVTGSGGGVSASGSGSLEAGQSTGVRVTRNASFCIGSGTGSVSFSSGASATVHWYC